jgi:hypothetical protein
MNLESRLRQLERAHPTVDADEAARAAALAAFDYGAIEREWDAMLAAHGGDEAAAEADWMAELARLLGPTDQQAAETLATLAQCDPEGTRAMLAQAQQADAGKPRVVAEVVTALDGHKGLVVDSAGKVLPLRLCQARAEAQDGAVLVVVERTVEAV